MNLIDVTATIADASKVNTNFIEVDTSMASIDNRVTILEGGTSTGGNYRNVKDYGAIGDGITDNTLEIQDAIDDASLSGGVVFFPTGTYVSGTLALYSNITLLGEGQTASILKLRSGVEAPLVQRLTSASNVHLQYLGFDGNKAGNALAGHPIEFHDVTDSSVVHCAIYNSRQNGLRWDGCTGNLIAFNHVYGNTFCGIRCGETGTSVHTRIIGNYTLNNDVIGISVDSVSRFIISLNNSNNNGDNGIDLCASNQCIVSNNQCLSNTNQGIAIDGWTYAGKHCDDDIITGNVCMYNGQYGFDTANGNNRLIVTGNSLLNNAIGSFRDTGSGTGKKIKENQGYITEGAGVVQVTSGNTYVDVTHGLSKAPLEQDIRITRTSNGGSSTKYWLSNVGITTFRINLDVNPGVSGAWFGWKVTR